MFALACALLVPIATAMPVAAQNPTLTQSGGPTSGPPGTVITYTYSYGDNCANITGYTPPFSVVLEWNGTAGPSTGASDPNCTGTLSESVPLGTGPGSYPIAGYLQELKPDPRGRQRGVSARLHRHFAHSAAHAPAHAHPDPASHA